MAFARRVCARHERPTTTKLTTTAEPTSTTTVTTRPSSRITHSRALWLPRMLLRSDGGTNDSGPLRTHSRLGAGGGCYVNAQGTGNTVGEASSLNPSSQENKNFDLDRASFTTSTPTARFTPRCHSVATVMKFQGGRRLNDSRSSVARKKRDRAARNLHACGCTYSWGL